MNRQPCCLSNGSIYNSVALTKEYIVDRKLLKEHIESMMHLVNHRERSVLQGLLEAIELNSNPHVQITESESKVLQYIGGARDRLIFYHPEEPYTSYTKYFKRHLERPNAPWYDRRILDENGYYYYDEARDPQNEKPLDIRIIRKSRNKVIVIATSVKAPEQIAMQQGPGSAGSASASSSGPASTPAFSPPARLGTIAAPRQMRMQLPGVVPPSTIGALSQITT